MSGYSEELGVQYGVFPEWVSGGGETRERVLQGGRRDIQCQTRTEETCSPPPITHTHTRGLINSAIYPLGGTVRMQWQ